MGNSNSISSKLGVMYAGVSLKNPFVVSSSGLTDSVSKVKELESAGCGAVVLKSLFEEQILSEGGALLSYGDYPEAHDYVSHYVESNRLSDYLALIEGCKRSCTIPIFASINAVSQGSWTSYVSQFERSGADGVEINLFGVPTPERSGEEMVQGYVELIRSIRKEVTFPIVVKISSHFTHIPEFVSQLKSAGASAVVLFNRFARHTINIDSEQVEPTAVFTHPIEFYNTLRWITLVKRQVPSIDLACSTGVFGYDDAIRALLAGATVVELCSTIYQHSPTVLGEFVRGVESWMSSKGYRVLSEFQGRIVDAHFSNGEQFERFQFMKHFSGRE